MKSTNLSIPVAVVITLIIAVFGWSFYRMEKTEERTMLITSLLQEHEKLNLETFGKINERLGAIDNNLSWLKEMMDEYRKANKGQLNISDFFQALESGEIKNTN